MGDKETAERYREGVGGEGSIRDRSLAVGLDEFVARGGSSANLFASRLPRRRISRIRRPTWPTSRRPTVDQFG